MMSGEQFAVENTKPGNGCLCFAKQAVALILVLAALGFIFIAGTMYSDVAQSMSSEPVYEGTPEQVNPALEGKLVKMRVNELVAEGGPVVDETFGLCGENTIALRRFFQLPQHRGEWRVRAHYHELHGVREASFVAPVVKAGAYTLRVRESFCAELGGEYLNPDALTLPAAWENRVEASTKHGIILCTEDTANLASEHVVFRYIRIASPWRGVLYMVGRQCGNALDLTDKDCGLIRGEEEFRRRHRIRPVLGMTGTDTREYALCLLGLQGVITLCFFPAVLMVQKRGWLRAAVVAALLGMLLCFLVAGAWLLLPYSVCNSLTCAYTMVPSLIAFALLCIACWNRSASAD